MNKLSSVTALLAVVAPLALDAQILQYRFSGTVEGNHPDVDFHAKELPLSDSTIRFGDTITGDIWIDPVFWQEGDFPVFLAGNRNYELSFLDAEVQINGKPFLASEGRHLMDIGVFNSEGSDPGGLDYPLSDKVADAVIFVPSYGSHTGIRRVGVSEERFTFVLNLTDSSGSVFQRAHFPESIDLAQFDLAKGFIRPWSEEESDANSGVMFQIDSFEQVATHVRPVIDQGPQNQTVKAGESIQLTMLEVRGNRGVECQWSLNGVDLPGETLPGLRLDNIQPSQAGTYRVTAWNNLGTTNVAAARVVVEGTRHFLQPLDLMGWNADVIVQKDEGLEGQDPFDGQTAYWFAADLPDRPDGFPETGGITSAVNGKIRYALQPYDAENALLQLESNSSGVLTLDQPGRYTFLAVLAASAGGSDDEMGGLVLHFADGSTSEEIPLLAEDWWTIPKRSAAAAIAGLGRLVVSAGEGPEYESSGGYGFGLYETEIDLVSMGLANKEIESFEFLKPASSTAMGVFAVSGQAAELGQGFHVSWPSEGTRQLFEVAIAPEGPWMKVASEVNVTDGRNYATVHSAIMPRFSRSSLPEFERDLYAHYDFTVDGSDRLGSGSDIDFGLEGEWIDHTQFIAEKPVDLAEAVSAPGARVSELTYSRYTLGLDFFPMNVPAKGKQTIVKGGILNRWIHFYSDDGNLTFSFDDGRIVEVFEDTEVLAHQWHRLLCAVEIRRGFIHVLFDGEPMLSLEFGGRYRYQTHPTTVNSYYLALNFFGMEGMESFSGYIDNLMLFRVGYSEEQLLQIHQALEPSRLVLESGSSEALDETFSVGRSLVWESNLDAFELQRSVSPTGPWTSVEPLTGRFNERFLYPMVTTGEMGLFRLRTARRMGL